MPKKSTVLPIPEDVIFKKYEATDIHEDDNLIHDMYRHELKQTGPLKSSFESDMRRTNNGSATKLSLRLNGGLSAATPDLPDGTFLDKQFMSKDSRNGMLDPDMQQHKGQQIARSKYVKFYTDSDNSILESGVAPSKHSKNIRQTQDFVKSRLSDRFDEATVNIQSHKTLEIRDTAPHSASVVIKDGKLDPFKAPSKNKSFKKVSLNDNTSISWRKGIDHKFKIATYGRTAHVKNLKNTDYYKNRGSASQDHEVKYINTEVSPATQAIAEQMVNFAERRKIELQNVLGIDFGTSTIDIPKQIIKLDNTQTKSSKNIIKTQSQSAHTKLNGMQHNIKLKHQSDRGISTLQNNSVINPTIFEGMLDFNKKMAPYKIKDLRDKISKTGKESGIFIKHSNSKSQNIHDTEISKNKYKSLSNYTRGVEKKIHTYKAKKYSTSGSNMPKYAYEEYKTNSQKLKVRRANKDKMKNIKSTDTYFSPISKFNPHTIGKVGSMKKYKIKQSIYQNKIYNEMGELDSFKK